LAPGEIVGLAGESGSGKSTLALGACRLLRPPAVITGGSVIYRGRRVSAAGVEILDLTAHVSCAAAVARDRDRLPERDERAQPGAASQ
jgi:ABC-type glutathione transport system ATPase component